MKPSVNPWDWIGHGIYFWEHSPSRAMEFAQTQAKRRNSIVKTPAVVGAVLDLGNCLDLLDYQQLTFLQLTYNQLDDDLKELQNKPVAGGDPDELFLRYLDCAVIEQVHDYQNEVSEPSFDSVRAVFWGR